MRRLGKIVKWLGIVLVLLAGTAFAVLTLVPSFGEAPSGARLERVERSPQYGNGAFVNPERQAPYDLGWDYLHQQFFGTQQREPEGRIPVVAWAPERLAGEPAQGLRITWMGHATVLVEIDGKRVLTDPVFSDYASPFQGLGPRRFHPPPVALADLRGIDAVVISHDHFDHLDMATVQQLARTGTRFFVPLGVGAHFHRWSIPLAQVTELDWWQSADLDGLRIVSTPNRHYSGRKLIDYKATLWSSWAVIGPRHRVFFSGDSGYSKFFARIGAELGPFDVTLIKVGAYGPGQAWRDIHMTPEDSLRIHTQLQGKAMLPLHWATFNLALHDWTEPMERALAAAAASGAHLLTPRIGETVAVGAGVAATHWWREVR